MESDTVFDPLALLSVVDYEIWLVVGVLSFEGEDSRGESFGSQLIKVDVKICAHLFGQRSILSLPSCGPLFVSLMRYTYSHNTNKRMLH